MEREPVQMYHPNKARCYLVRLLNTLARCCSFKGVLEKNENMPLERATLLSGAEATAFFFFNEAVGKRFLRGAYLSAALLFLTN